MPSILPSTSRMLSTLEVKISDLNEVTTVTSSEESEEVRQTLLFVAGTRRSYVEHLLKPLSDL